MTDTAHKFPKQRGRKDGKTRKQHFQQPKEKKKKNNSQATGPVAEGKVRADASPQTTPHTKKMWACKKKTMNKQTKVCMSAAPKLRFVERR